MDYKISWLTRGRLTDEVANWLEGLLLSHNESDLLGLLVSHQLAVACASLFPLVVSEPVDLASLSEDALLGLLSSDFSHGG